MFKNKPFYADGAATGGGPQEPTVNHTGALPEADVDFMDVAKTVAATWLANPAITLLWKTSAAFNAEVLAYVESLTGRIATGSLRPGQSQTLRQLDVRIDTAVTEVKVYIEKKFKTENATAQFARYGIVKENRAWVLSRDRNNRNASFTLMMDAIRTDGFEAEEYGTNFWTRLKDEYAVALAAASNTTGDVSGKVATKNQQKQAIRKVLASLLFVLRGNYPETYPEMYRKWGLKKESY